MTEDIKEFQRWYDKDPVVSKCISILENIETAKKHRTATFLTNEIILKPPYRYMLPEELYNLVMSEQRKRRWYDFDKIVKVFVELLRYAPDESKKEIAIKAITFLEKN